MRYPGIREYPPAKDPEIPASSRMTSVGQIA